MLDTSRSRRGYYNYCRWWSRKDNDTIPNSEYQNNIAASGTFYAKELASETDEDGNIGGAFLVEKSVVTIKSPDNLTGISDKDLVEYNGYIWRVTSIQKKSIKKQSGQFLKDKYAPHIWILNLRR